MKVYNKPGLVAKPSKQKDVFRKTPLKKNLTKKLYINININD